MTLNRDITAIIYDSDYNVANLAEVAEKIRQERQSMFSVISIKNLVGEQPMFKEALTGS